MVKIYLLVSICILNCSCKKNIETYDYFPAPSLIGSLVKFDKGSYWIYLDSLNQHLDTLDIIYVSHSIKSTTSSKYYDEYKFYGKGKNNEKFYSSILTYYKDNYLFAYNNTSYPHLINPINTLPHPDINFDYKLDTLTVQGNLFEDVFVFNCKKDITVTYKANNTKQTLRYYVPHVGLIKVVGIDTNYVRDLVSYHVIKLPE